MQISFICIFIITLYLDVICPEDLGTRHSTISRSIKMLLQEESIIDRALTCDFFGISLPIHLVAAMEKVNKIWERISRFDQWYLMDIRMMNVILYFFESDVVISITDKLIERLKVYQNYDEAARLKNTLTINLSLILIRSGMMSEALSRLENFLQLHLKDLSYKSLAVCLNRIAICYSYIKIKFS